MNADKANASSAEDNAFDLPARVAEVAQQADLQARGAKGVDALGAMELNHRLDGRSVRWSSTVSSAFIGVHRRLKIASLLRTNTLPKS